MQKTIDYIVKHSLNRSKSKNSHVFSKSSRFPKTKQSPCLQSSYDLTRSAAFGSSSGNTRSQANFARDSRFRAHELQLKRKSLSPSPNAYDNMDFVYITTRDRRGNAFGQDQRMKKKTSEVPGPGSYNAAIHNPQISLSYTMRNKTKRDDTHWNKIGPGQYQPSTKLVTKKTKTHTLGHQERFRRIRTDGPDPGSYNVNRGTDVTKFKNSNLYSFGKNRRQMNLGMGERTPGPGTYADFSQFSEGSHERIQKVTSR